MDSRLIRDARAVKRRTRGKFPALWLFSDIDRLPDPLPAIARLPRDIGGVVFRHDNAPNRPELARQVARLCRNLGLTLVIAGDARLAARLGAGYHLRPGPRPLIKLPRPVTASAHNFTELKQAAHAGADVVFLSPAFATASHPGVPSIGALRWARWAKSSGIPVLALGGMNGPALRRLGRFCAGAGAIGALYI